MWVVPVSRRLLLCLAEVEGLLGSCSLSFSHLGTISPDDDLPDRGLFLGLGSFAPLMELVTSFLARELDPSEVA
jgi:hypothetical protein